MDMASGLSSALGNVTTMSTPLIPPNESLSIATRDFGGRGSPALLVHAAGFCAQVLSPLARHLSHHWQSYAIDLRGHGASDSPTTALTDWSGFAEDVISSTIQLGLVRPLGIGHSLGGVALLLAEATHPGSFSQLYCFEPPIYLQGERRSQHVEDLIIGASRRRSVFESRAQALEQFRSRPPLDVIDPEVLGLYVEHGFFDCDDETIRLACAPNFEAQIYATAPTSVELHLDEIACNVTFAYGKDGGEEVRRRYSILRDTTSDARLDGVQGIGHFGPMQDPRAIAASIIRMSERADT